jgi:hypothetical protein
MEVPAHAREGQIGRGHRFAAYPRCSADPEALAEAGRRVEERMDRKELIRQYKETPRPMGVFRVHNTVADRSFVGTSRDLPSMLNRQRFQLEHGSHPNRELQEDWDRLGAAAFAFGGGRHAQAFRAGRLGLGGGSSRPWGLVAGEAVALRRAGLQRRAEA